jgi:citrate synthase
MKDQEKSTVDTGLYGVPVSLSGISTSCADADGNPLVLYRGYNIYDLVKGSFEESVYLILNGELPNKEELKHFSLFLKNHSALNPETIKHIATYPKNVNRMDFLLTTLSFARMFDEDYENPLWKYPRSDEERWLEIMRASGLRLGAKIPTIIAYGHRLINGLDPIPPNNELSFAGNLLHMMGLSTDEKSVKALDTSLILYLDHTINNSTFIARVAESARGDSYGPLIAAAVGLKGVLHGGANELAADMLERIGSPDNAEKYVLDKMSKGEAVYGFGHRLPNYKGNVESRVLIATEVAKSLLKEKKMDSYVDIFNIVIKTMIGEKVEERKRRSPNLDLPTCLIYKSMGIDSDWNTPIFQASRHFGWLAHLLEQRINRCPLYRPTQEDADKCRVIKEYTPLTQR